MALTEGGNMAVATDEVRITVRGAKGCWEEMVDSEVRVWEVLKFLKSELKVGKTVSLILIIRNKDTVVEVEDSP
jgi:hypothetical protein